MDNQETDEASVVATKLPEADLNFPYRIGRDAATKMGLNAAAYRAAENPTPAPRYSRAEFFQGVKVVGAATAVAALEQTPFIRRVWEGIKHLADPTSQEQHQTLADLNRAEEILSKDRPLSQQEQSLISAMNFDKEVGEDGAHVRNRPGREVGDWIIDLPAGYKISQLISVDPVEPGEPPENQGWYGFKLPDGKVGFIAGITLKKPPTKT